MILLLFSYFIKNKPGRKPALLEENERLKKLNIGLARNLEEYEVAVDIYMKKILELSQENDKMGNVVAELSQFHSRKNLELASISKDLKKFRRTLGELEEKEHDLELLLLRERHTTAALKDYLYYAAHDSERNFAVIVKAFYYLQEKLKGTENLPDVPKLLQYQNTAIEEFRFFISNLFYIAKRERNRIDHVVLSEVRIKEFFCKVISIIDIDAVMFGRQVVSLIYTSVIPETIETDETMLRQIVVNLLINAKERTTGAVFVLLSANPTHLSFQILNQGKPIPDEIMGKIFDRNFTTNRTTGKGVGLTITQKLTLALGGTITASNQTNVGPVFSVTIPIAYSQKTMYD